MALPFLPASLINPTFTLLQTPNLENLVNTKLQKLKQYFRRRWLHQIRPEELSIFDLTITTNNGAESYHSKLKSIIRTSHPRIWTFLSTLNQIIQDTDNDIGRLCLGLEISRSQKKKNIRNFERRMVLKQKFSDGELNPWEFLKTISHTIGSLNTNDSVISSSNSEHSDDEVDDIPLEGNKCAVCFAIRTSTWIFMPCRHANCCESVAKIFKT